MENNPADRHGHQQQAGKKKQQPGEHPPDAGLWGKNAPLSLEAVGLPQYSRTASGRNLPQAITRSWMFLRRLCATSRNDLNWFWFA